MQITRVHSTEYSGAQRHGTDLKIMVDCGDYSQQRLDHPPQRAGRWGGCRTLTRQSLLKEPSQTAQKRHAVFVSVRDIVTYSGDLAWVISDQINVRASYREIVSHY